MPPTSVLLAYRPATEDDLPFLYELFRSTRELELSAMPDWNEEQKQTFLKQQFSAQRNQYQAAFPNAKHNIILRKNKPVGRIYTDTSDTEIRLLDIIVSPKRRDLGIGSYCMEQLKQEATKANVPLRFYVWQSNLAAQRFYERHGCVKLGELGAYIFMGWHPTDDIFKYTYDARYS